MYLMHQEVSMAGKGWQYPSLDTPVVLIDMDRMEANIKDMSERAKSAGVKLRPHVKIHESAEIAKMQIAAGACGIDTGSLGQAEAMASAGISDILISHPTYYGGIRLEKFTKLIKNDALKISVNLDMVEQAEGVSRAGKAAGKNVPVSIKVDTNASLGGVGRLGVMPGKELVEMARKISKLSNVELKGIYAHEMVAIYTPEALAKFAMDTGLLTADAAAMLRKEGFNIETVSVGASPTFRYTCQYIKEGKLKGITEIDPGNCVIGDLVYMRTGGNTFETIAATVLTTVVSTSHPEKAAIDAGYKTFGADFIVGAVKDPGYYWNGMPSFGRVKGNPDLWCGRLSAETGYVYYKEPSKTLTYGERIEIYPNNNTLVINLHNEIYGVRNGHIEHIFKVTARGAGN
jgi:D-serine deaminase-like pyridoxal phosphate-dependent protein